MALRKRGKYFVFFGAKIELQIRTMDSFEDDRIEIAREKLPQLYEGNHWNSSTEIKLN